jgi:hypothetical protein
MLQPINALNGLDLNGNPSGGQVNGKGLSRE